MPRGCLAPWDDIDRVSPARGSSGSQVRQHLGASRGHYLSSLPISALASTPFPGRRDGLHATRRGSTPGHDDDDGRRPHRSVDAQRAPRSATVEGASRRVRLWTSADSATSTSSPTSLWQPLAPAPVIVGDNCLPRTPAILARRQSRPPPGESHRGLVKSTERWYRMLFRG